MKIQCPNCNETTELTFEVDWKHFACPHCQTLYQRNLAGGMEQVKFLSKTTTPPSLHIGQQGVLEGVLWEVGGFCIKNVVNEPYGWQEYTLYNKTGEVCFLSESDGHWILAKEIETGEKFDIDAHYAPNFGVTYKDEDYALFASSEFYTAYAAGIFDHPVPERGKAKDFIKLPHGLLLEKSDGEETFAFFARHVSKQELQKAFHEITLPEPVGQGMLQPFFLDMSSFWIAPAIVGGIVLLWQILLTGYYPSYKVLSEHVLLPDTVAEVTHISPSFTCTGIVAPLKIQLSAPVDNSWAGVDFCLVNEETKEERFGSVEVAYYHGVDGGESWSEGDSRPSIKICGVSPGPYHLVMQVAKEPNKPDIKALQYTVTARPFNIGNLLWALGLLIVAIVAAVLWRSHFEKQRWMYSDFPPETEEDDY